MPWTDHDTTTTARGYGTPHQTERRRWATHLAEHGSIRCAQPVCIEDDPMIYDGQLWHLGHNDDRTHWIGPVHPRCNARDAAVRGNRRSRGLDDDETTPTRWIL